MDQQPVDILLVEDNPDHVELILKVLQDNNVLNQVHVVTNGEKALNFLYQREEYAEAPRPGLILLAGVCYWLYQTAAKQFNKSQ